MATKKHTASAPAAAKRGAHASKTHSKRPASAALLAEARAEQAKLDRVKRRLAAELARYGMIPASPGAGRHVSRFLRQGTLVNAALTRAARLENRSAERIADLIAQLNTSSAYRRLDDDACRVADDAKQGELPNYALLQMHARLFLAGMLAGQDERWPQ